MSCPNKALPEWKLLVQQFDETTAYEIYMRNGFEVPPMEKVKNIIEDNLDAIQKNKKMFANSLYRGVRDVNIDSEGNLILKPGYDNLFKGHGISFAETQGHAENYAYAYSRNPYVFEINKDFLLQQFEEKLEGGTQEVDAIVYGEEGEQRVITKKTIVVPKGQYNLVVQPNLNVRNMTFRELSDLYNLHIAEDEFIEFYQADHEDYQTTIPQSVNKLIEDELLRRGVSKEELKYVQSKKALDFVKIDVNEYYEKNLKHDAEFQKELEKAEEHNVPFEDVILNRIINDIKNKIEPDPIRQQTQENNEIIPFQKSDDPYQKTFFKKAVGYKGENAIYSEAQFWNLWRKVKDFNEKHKTNHKITRKQFGQAQGYQVTVEMESKPPYIQGTLFQKGDTPQVQKERIRQTIDKLAKQIDVPVKMISEKEADEIGKRMKGYNSTVSAFIHDGTVYFVNERLTNDSPVHEFLHPFVIALMEEQPELFAKFMEEIYKTPEGALIEQRVMENYAETVNADGTLNEFGHAEVMVRWLTEKIMNREDEMQFEKKSLFQRIWDWIKDWFSKKTEGSFFSTLNENSTLGDIVNAFLGNEKILIRKDLRGTESFQKSVNNEEVFNLGNDRIGIFEQKGHTYVIADANRENIVTLNSSTTITKSLFEKPFDIVKIAMAKAAKDTREMTDQKQRDEKKRELAEKYKRDWEDLADLGTVGHRVMEAIINNEEMDQIEVEGKLLVTHFKNKKTFNAFVLEMRKKIKEVEKQFPGYRAVAELTLFNEEYLAAGRTDLIFVNDKTRKIKIVDFKFSGKSKYEREIEVTDPETGEVTKRKLEPMEMDEDGVYVEKEAVDKSRKIPVLSEEYSKSRGNRRRFKRDSPARSLQATKLNEHKIQLGLYGVMLEKHPDFKGYEIESPMHIFPVHLSVENGKIAKAKPEPMIKLVYDGELCRNILKYNRRKMEAANVVGTNVFRILQNKQTDKLQANAAIHAIIQLRILLDKKSLTTVTTEEIEKLLGTDLATMEDELLDNHEETFADEEWINETRLRKKIFYLLKGTSINEKSAFFTENEYFKAVSFKEYAEEKQNDPDFINATESMQNSMYEVYVKQIDLVNRAWDDIEESINNFGRLNYNLAMSLYNTSKIYDNVAAASLQQYLLNYLYAYNIAEALREEAGLYENEDLEDSLIDFPRTTLKFYDEFINGDQTRHLLSVPMLLRGNTAVGKFLYQYTATNRQLSGHRRAQLAISETESTMNVINTEHKFVFDAVKSVRKALKRFGITSEDMYNMQQYTEKTKQGWDVQKLNNSYTVDSENRIKEYLEDTLGLPKDQVKEATIYVKAYLNAFFEYSRNDEVMDMLETRDKKLANTLDQARNYNYFNRDLQFAGLPAQDKGSTFIQTPYRTFASPKEIRKFIGGAFSWLVNNSLWKLFRPSQLDFVNINTGKLDADNKSIIKTYYELKTELFDRIDLWNRIKEMQKNGDKFEVLNEEDYEKKIDELAEQKEDEDEVQAVKDKYGSAPMFVMDGVTYLNQSAIGKQMNNIDLLREIKFLNSMKKKAASKLRTGMDDAGQKLHDRSRKLSTVGKSKTLMDSKDAFQQLKDGLSSHISHYHFSRIIPFVDQTTQYYGQDTKENRLGGLRNHLDRFFDKNIYKRREETNAIGVRRTLNIAMLVTSIAVLGGRYSIQPMNLAMSISNKLLFHPDQVFKAIGNYLISPSSWLKDLNVVKMRNILRNQLSIEVVTNEKDASIIGKVGQGIMQFLMLPMTVTETFNSIFSLLGKFTKEELDSFDWKGNLIPGKPGLSEGKKTLIIDTVREINGSFGNYRGTYYNNMGGRLFGQLKSGWMGDQIAARYSPAGTTVNAQQYVGVIRAVADFMPLIYHKFIAPKKAQKMIDDYFIEYFGDRKSYEGFDKLTPQEIDQAKGDIRKLIVQKQGGKATVMTAFQAKQTVKGLAYLALFSYLYYLKFLLGDDEEKLTHRYFDPESSEYIGHLSEEKLSLEQLEELQRIKKNKRMIDDYIGSNVFMGFDKIVKQGDATALAPPAIMKVIKLGTALWNEYATDNNIANYSTEKYVAGESKFGPDLGYELIRAYYEIKNDFITPRTIEQMSNETEQFKKKLAIYAMASKMVYMDKSQVLKDTEEQRLEKITNEVLNNGSYYENMYENKELMKEFWQNDPYRQEQSIANEIISKTSKEAARNH